MRHPVQVHFSYMVDYDLQILLAVTWNFLFSFKKLSALRKNNDFSNKFFLRYYCMEQDRMFRYIALELCQATLSEYMQGKCDTTIIKPLDILNQATSGLAHLHSLDIGKLLAVNRYSR